MNYNQKIADPFGWLHGLKVSRLNSYTECHGGSAEFHGFLFAVYLK